MKVLVINCGSSSIKADLLDAATGVRVRTARAERVGTEECAFTIEDAAPQSLPGAAHEAVLGALLPELVGTEQPEAVGHRVVHGGSQFTEPTLIDDGVESAIEQLSALAPLHNPPALAGIRAARQLFGGVPMVAVFDTAFHSTLPTRARTYALPAELSERHELRRYGFHGTSHAWVAERAAEKLGADLRDLRLITCHLGNGASVTAVEFGRSVETSMGMTPLEGLVMGSRSGDVDAGILIELMRRDRLGPNELDELLNKQSGLTGLSGRGNDMRDIEARAAEGDERCRLAIQVFAHRVRKYIGAYSACMGGVDAIVFTGGIGQNSALIRHRVAQRLGYLGARLDEHANRDADVTREQPTAIISEPHSRTVLVVVATDEQHAIARETAKLLRAPARPKDELAIPIAVSARHIHLTTEAVEALFGPGHELTPAKPLSQPGQFASEETLTIVGPKRSIEGVRVLGPVRGKCQIEISRTDEFFLGVDAPVRNSGDVDQSPGITLVGPAGALTLTQGLICARRHIHMTPEDAQRFGVIDRDVVSVVIDSDGRDLTFGDVLIRVSPKYALEMHIDTDEANAAELSSGAEGALVPTGGCAHIIARSIRHSPAPPR